MAQPLSPATWAALLAHWTHFAQSAAALPTEGEPGRWRRAVPDIIGLQAITFALGDLDSLPLQERNLGLDRAELGVTAHIRSIHDLWRGEDLPPGLVDLIDDARLALSLAHSRGVEWIACEPRFAAAHPADLVATLLSRGFDGDLYLATPGVRLFEPCPAAFARAARGGSPDAAVCDAIGTFLDASGECSGPDPAPFFRQAYRQFDFAKGRPVRDLVAPFDAGPRPGQPLLVPVILGGEAQRVTLPQRSPQNIDDLPVEFESDGSMSEQ